MAERYDIRGLASRYSAEAGKRQRKAERLGKRHRAAYFLTSIGAVVAGVVAGIAGLAESEPLAVGVAGFTASALAAIAPTVNAKRLAAFHFAQGAEYGAIGSLFEILAVGPVEPGPSEIEDLVERLAQCQERLVDGD